MKVGWSLFAAGAALACGHAAEWTVPLAGNTFRTAPGPGGRGLQRDGDVRMSGADEVYSIYFHLNRPAAIDLSLQGQVPEGQSSVTVRVLDHRFIVPMEGAELRLYPIGRVEIPRPGYVKVDLQGPEKTEADFLDARALLVSSEAEDLALDYVKSNEGNMFYWGRRGPSVHLRYETPRDRSLQYAYSEITVPEGRDPIGSYFMANGFAEGYFGIQVNSSEERRVLFSVWSPFKTDNPREIPEDQRIITLARGREVQIREFGNEGSGGQSFLVYPWKAGRAYRFLTEVRPDGEGRTIYTSWFGDKAAHEWKLIASFRRPNTDTWLRGFHSFLENFQPAHGHIERLARHGNVWVRDQGGKWHECTRARFSVDATGESRHRLDFIGGADGPDFYLRNCGFFSETGKPGTNFERNSSGAESPKIDFDALPRE